MTAACIVAVNYLKNQPPPHRNHILIYQEDTEKPVSLVIADTLIVLNNLHLVPLPLSKRIQAFRGHSTTLNTIEITFTDICPEPALFRRTDFEKNIVLSTSARGNGHLFSCPTGQFETDLGFSNILLWSPFEAEIADEYDGYPLLQIILWGNLCLRGGCYLHGTLLVIDDKYLLFLGASGTGKTTLSKIAAQLGFTCLTEENPLVTLSDTAPLVHSSPWYGIHGPYKPLSGKLSAIFFLRHDKTNTITRMTTEETSRKIIKNTRMFNWLPETIPLSIDTLNTTIRSVPVYDFGFLPDGSAIEKIRSIV